MSKKITDEIYGDPSEKVLKLRESTREKSQTRVKRNVSEKHAQVNDSQRIKSALTKLGPDRADSQNPGLRLYSRGVQHTQERERQREEAKREKEQKEIVDNCTFKPKLITSNYTPV